MSTVNFNDFNQDYRYSLPVETKLIISLPVTDVIPEALRVTERKAENGTWYEVEIFNTTLNQWIDQKTHPTEAAAVADAKGWYPQAERNGNMKYKIRNVNGEFWGTENDGVISDDVYSSLMAAVNESDLFIKEAIMDGLLYDDEDIEIVSFSGDSIVNTNTLDRVKISDYELALTFSCDSYLCPTGEHPITFVGKILGQTELYVVQNLGRQSAIHLKSNLTGIINNGEMVNIIYDGKGAGVAKSEQIQKEVSR